ncbi:MAG: type II toxin-antitoxin system VapC family toxin [Pleurocapsa sp. MO_192.B19]|nr:type II toxin-antitoxin system VapC family toxin [Pleurocapsa sp. MO_192.B19]
MKILLDTQIFLWALAEPKRLGENAKSLLRSQENQLYLSAASSWEISIKVALGKLPLPEAPDKYISSRMANLKILPLDVKHHHTFIVYKLPLHHRDPFDRILIASSIAENFHLMSADEQFRHYEIDLLWGFD